MVERKYIFVCAHYTQKFAPALSLARFSHSEAWALQMSLTRPSFSQYFWEIRKKPSSWPGSESASRLFKRYNLCPCSRPWPGPELKFSKTVDVWWLRFTTLSARDGHWQNPRKKNYRECSNIKACLLVHWRALCHLKWPRGCKDTQLSQLPSGIKPKSPYSLETAFWSLEKNVYYSS